MITVVAKCRRPMATWNCSDSDDGQVPICDSSTWNAWLDGTGRSWIIRPATKAGGCNSVGRVPRCQRGCRGFESHHPLSISCWVALNQSGCGAVPYSSRRRKTGSTFRSQPRVRPPRVGQNAIGSVVVCHRLERPGTKIAFELSRLQSKDDYP